MSNFPMRATMSAHLNDGMSLDSRVQNSGTGVMQVGTWSREHWELILFGSAANLRTLAEGLHKLADEVERTGKRQRALDNAPAKSRTTFVLEGDDISIAV